MANLLRTALLATTADAAWDAIRDIGNVHRRLVPGVLTDARLDGDTRVVTFANCLVVSELIVDCSDARRRLAYAAVGGSARHHHATLQVDPIDATHCRLTWETDVLPDSLAERIGALMDLGMAAIVRTLSPS